MKKATTLLLALVMTLCGSLPALASEITLVNEGGIELRLLKCSVQSSTENPSLYIEIRAINDTDSKVWIDLEDVKADGVPVLSTTRSVGPHTDTGNDAPLLYSVWGSDDDGGAGAAAIADAQELEMVIDVTDNDTYEHLITETVTIDIAGAADSGADDYTDTSTGSDTHSYAPAYTPASYDFGTLKIGSKGQAVRDLQQRLTDLGYMNNIVDGSYGKITATAVMSFCTQHDLYISGDATPEMQSLLYSSNAQYYEEPWVPLIIGPQYKWNDPVYADLDNGVFYVQIVNRSSTRTVRGYELYYYKTDVWGNRYVEPTTDTELLQKTTLTQTVEPGYIVYSDPIMIYPFSWTYSVWVGVHKIVFDDGEIREIDPDEIVYFECPVKS